MKTEKNYNEITDVKAIKKSAIIRMILAFLIMGLAFFPTAGTIRFWEAWAYMATLLVPMLIFGIRMFRRDPKFLERRLKTREKRKEQKLIMKLAIFPFILIYLIPGLDRRFGWSDVPVYMVVAGLILSLGGYLMILYVFRVNTYASRVVEVAAEQKVITTGPYSRVRHPMYTAAIILYGVTPLALGSYWALIPAVLILPVFAFRLIDEENELMEHLHGYREYTEKVKNRLIPGIW